MKQAYHFTSCLCFIYTWAWLHVGNAFKYDATYCFVFRCFMLVPVCILGLFQAFGDGLVVFVFLRCVLCLPMGFSHWVSALGFSVWLLLLGFWLASALMCSQDLPGAARVARALRFAIVIKFEELRAESIVNLTLGFVCKGNPWPIL